MNKKDLLAEKIQISHLADYFPEFDGLFALLAKEIFKFLSIYSLKNLFWNFFWFYLLIRQNN